MARFPLPFIPTSGYHKGSGKRWFGVNRGPSKYRAGKDRLHAACDLIAKPGTPVLAVEWGIVLHGPNKFYDGTYDLIVEHSSFIARYGEIAKKAPDEVFPGMYVNEGQTIAFVGTNSKGGGMLHFEMYDKSATGAYSQPYNGPYERRKDLIDPTPYLDRWKLWTQFGDFIESVF